MGNASSAAAQGALQALSKVSGREAIALDDPLWQALLAYSTPLSRFDPVEVEAEIRPACANLVYNNSATLNCQRLLYQLAAQLRRGAAAPTSPAAQPAANAAYLARTLVLLLAQQLTPGQLLGLVELPPPGQQPPSGSPGGAAAGAAAGSPGGAAGAGAAAAAAELSELEGGSLVATLTCAALEAVAGATPESTAGAGGYLLALEGCHLALALCSTQLASPSARPDPGAHPFLECAMQHKALAPRIVESLLRLFVASPAPPLALRLALPRDTRSVLRVVRSAAASVLWLPYTALTYLVRRPAPAGAPPSPLAEAGTLLLLVLAFFPAPPDAPWANPYRGGLHRLRDADELVPEDAAEGGRGGAGGGAPAAKYGALYEALGRGLGSERTLLLLYLLLHGTPHFHEYFLVRADLETVLLPLAELLYAAPGRGGNPNQTYMLLIVVLLLSQDSGLAAGLHRVQLQSVPFYKERPGMRTTLGSLLAVLLLRAAHANLARGARDVYLHTNTLAALANLAPHMTGLSSHAAQRLVALFHLLARRYSRLEAVAAGAAPAAAAGAADVQPGGRPGSPPAGSRDRAATGAAAAAEGGEGLELQLYSDFLRIVLEIINSILQHGLAANPELVYALLHRQEVFEPFSSHPRYSELMENIKVVTDFFNRKVEEASARHGSPLSAAGVLEVIGTASRGWRRDRLRPFPELRFTYEEEASPEEFFVPYVWNLVVCQTPLPWDLAAVALFTPTLLPAAAAGAEASPEPQASMLSAGEPPLTPHAEVASPVAAV